MLNAMQQRIEPGQQWLKNRSRNPWDKTIMTLHVLSVFTDKLGKHKIAVQEQFPLRSTYSSPHYLSARIVTPSYFYGLTIKVRVKAKKKGKK